MTQEKFLEKVIEKLKKPETKWDAVIYLKEVKSPEYLNIFMQHLDEPDPFIRALMSEKLGSLQDTKAVPALTQLLKDPDLHVRKTTKDALLKFGVQAIPGIISSLADKDYYFRQRVVNFIQALGKPVIPVLSQEIEHSNWIVANKILEIIWKIGGAQAEEALIQAIEIENVRKSAILFLGLSASKKAVPKLLEIFKHYSLRRMVISSLMRIGEEEAYPLIVKSLNFCSYNITKQAQEAIVKIGQPMLPYLLAALRKKRSHKGNIIESTSKIDFRPIYKELHNIAQNDQEIEGLLFDFKILKKKTSELQTDLSEKSLSSNIPKLRKSSKIPLKIGKYI